MLVETTHDDAITTLRLNRTDKLNAFSGELLLELHAGLEAARERPETRVVIIAANGRAFSTGADLSEIQDHGPLQARDRLKDTWMRLFSTIETMDEPVIAAVHGHAIAGGTELLLACDLVVAAEDAVLGLVEARVGVLPGAGACVRLPRWIGRAAAKELLMTGDMIDAAEAHRLGLVNRVVAPAELDDSARGLASTLASRSPLALAATKRAVNIGAEMDIERGIAYVLQEFALLFAGSDQKEGMAAFLERREPEFDGR
jgi:enoyl-CoA hydratase/carnithine racemase